MADCLDIACCPCISIFYLMYAIIYILKIILKRAWHAKSVHIYIYDVTTDLITAYLHYSAGNTWWAFFTLLFVLLPMICIGTVNIYSIFQKKGNSIWGKKYYNHETQQFSVYNIRKDATEINYTQEANITKSVQENSCEVQMHVRNKSLQEVPKKVKVKDSTESESFQRIVENQIKNKSGVSSIYQRKEDYDCPKVEEIFSIPTLKELAENYISQKLVTVSPVQANDGNLTVQAIDEINYIQDTSVNKSVQELASTEVQVHVKPPPMQEVPKSVKVSPSSETDSVYDEVDILAVKKDSASPLHQRKEAFNCQIVQEDYSISTTNELANKAISQKMVTSSSVLVNDKNRTVHKINESQPMAMLVEDCKVQEAESSDIKMMVESREVVKNSAEQNFDIPPSQEVVRCSTSENLDVKSSVKSLVDHSYLQHPCFMWKKVQLTLGVAFTSPFMPLLHLLYEVVVSPIINDDRVNVNALSRTMKIERLINQAFSFILKPLDIFFTIPFIQQMLDSFSIIVGHGPDDSALNAGLVKLMDVMLESLFQAKLQLYIIAQEWDSLATVGIWQWITPSMSLIALAYGISTNQYVFQNGSSTRRLVIFLFGLINITCRIFVCCLYSLKSKYLMILPISLELGLSIMVWICRKGLSSLRGNDIFGLIIIFLSWVLTATFDCFTLSALPASIANMIFAARFTGLSTEEHLSAAIIALVLSTTCLIFNIVMAVVPLFIQNFEEQWMNRNTLHLSPEEIESKTFVLKYSTSLDVYVRPIKSDAPDIHGWKRGVYGLNGNMSREQDSSVAYLSPKLSDKTSTQTVTVRWRINWTGNSSLVLKSVSVKLPSTIYSHAKIHFYVAIGHEKFKGYEEGEIHMSNDNGEEVVRQEGMLELGEKDLTDLGPVKHMDVVATMSGGWNAQLFLQERTNTTDYPFLIKIDFK